MSEKTGQLWTPYHSSGDEESSDSSDASSTPERITPLATLCDAIDVMETDRLFENDTTNVLADDCSQNWTHYERSSSDEDSDGNSITYSSERSRRIYREEQSYINSVCSSLLEPNTPNEAPSSDYERGLDNSSYSSSEDFSANATLYNAIDALEDEDIGNAPSIVSNFFKDYQDDQEFIQANVDYRDNRNDSNTIVHLLITKMSDLVIPALQEIVEYDESLIKDTNDNLQTPFSFAISYNATIYMLCWLYKRCPSNAEVMNSVGAFPVTLLQELYPYPFEREELSKDLLYRIHITASIAPPNGFLKLVWDAKPDYIPVEADGEGKLPIHYACQIVDEKNIENVLTLSKCCEGSMQEKDKSGNTALCYLQSAARVFDEDGRSLLHKWALLNDTCSMEALRLLRDANPEAFFHQDRYECLPLHYLSMNCNSSLSVIFEAIKMNPTVLHPTLDCSAEFHISPTSNSNVLVESNADDETASVTNINDLFDFDVTYSPIVSLKQPFVKDTSGEITHANKRNDYEADFYDDIFSKVPDDWLDSSKPPTVKQHDATIKKTPLVRKSPIINPYANSQKKMKLYSSIASARTDSLSNIGAAITPLPSFPDQTITSNRSSGIDKDDFEDPYDPDGSYSKAFCALLDDSFDFSKRATVELQNTTAEKPSEAKKLIIENPYAKKQTKSVITPGSGSSALIPSFHQKETQYKGQQKSAPKALDAVFQQTTFVPTPIRDVQISNANKVKITGIVTWKKVGTYTQFSRKLQEGRYFIIYLRDINNDSICIKAFLEECDKFVDKVLHGGIYTVSGMIADTSKRTTYNVNFPPTNPTVLKITSDTVITRLIDDGKFPRPTVAPTKIINLSTLEKGDRVDIVAAICLMGSVYVPGRTMIREIQISDGTAFVKLTLFGEVAKTADKAYKIGDIIAVSQLKVTHFNGDVSLSHCGAPIIVNPTNIPEANDVANWWKTYDKKVLGQNIRVSMKK